MYFLEFLAWRKQNEIRLQAIMETHSSFVEILWKIKGNKNSIELAHIIVKEKLSARQVEQLVKAKEGRTKTIRNIVDVNIRKLEQELEEMIGLKTVIRDKSGKGQIIFNYKNLEQLDLVIKKIKK